MSVGNLIEKFRSVALDRVEQMNVLLVSLEREPGDDEAEEELLREIHTLKGQDDGLRGHQPGLPSD